MTKTDFFLIFCQNYHKFCFEQLTRDSSLIGDILEVFSKFTKFLVVIVSGGGDKAFFCISPDHMINESHELQIGAALCYKLGQLCFITNQGKCCYKLRHLHCYKLGQVLLQIGATITNQGNCYYKIGQLLQIGAKCITNWDRYYKLGQLFQIGA